MVKRAFFSLVMVAVVLSLVAFKPQPQAQKPIAIGALPVKGVHLVAPREDKILKDLQVLGRISKDSTTEQIQVAMEDYRAQFAKDSISWVNPEVAEKALAHEQALAKSEIGVTADPPVTQVDVTIFGLAVQFEEDGTPFDGEDCEGTPVSFDGPEAGHVEAPAAGDNNTLWYDPAVTLDLSVYHDIVFGYKGAGVVRTDLNSGAGVDLSGYTVQDYYDKVSGGIGNVNLMGDFFGWVDVPHGEEYYGAPICSGGVENEHDNHAQLLVTDAIDAFQTANPGFDWSDFDQNNDQIVDTFWVMHAGADQAAGGGAQGAFALWSHSSDLSYYAATAPNGYQVAGMDTPADPADDIYVGPYTMNPEIADVGVLSEEFGHNVFGLPDLYTTDVQNSVGFWTTMSAGSWGGPLGGAAPAGMPLWFRINAWCGVDYCNWQYPMVTRNYKASMADIEIGTLEDTPADTVKGVRVSLPTISETIPNWAGSGKAAYSGAGRDMASVTLERTIDVPALGTNLFSFDSYWEIETDYDYAYVVVKEAGDPTWTFLADEGGYSTTTNPNGSNLGVGLTDFSYDTVNLQYDLSAYAGKTITLRLWYKTDPGTTELGWWVDNVMLDSTVLDEFKSAAEPSDFPGWTNAVDTPWLVVPSLKNYTNYYLLEYRGNTKYDSQVQSAYITTASGDNLWTVERVPYNIPGGLLYYRNTKYPNNYSQAQWNYDEPSFGAKNKLLVVDMNWDRMPIGNTGSNFNNRVAAYDATIDLDGTEAFTVSSVYGITGGPFTFDAKPAVTQFNDALGYAPGLLIRQTTGSLYSAFSSGSTVIPARGHYSTRLRDLTTLDPASDYYGIDLGWATLGSGNPGDDNMQHGVNIQILNQTADAADTGASSGTFRFYNYSLDMAATQQAELVGYGTYRYTYEVTVTNSGVIPSADPLALRPDAPQPFVLQPASVRVILDPALTLVSATAPVTVTPIPTAVGTVVGWVVPQLDPGESVTLTIIANGLIDQNYHFIETVVVGRDGQINRGPLYQWDSYQVSNYFYPFLSSQNDIP